MLISLRGSLLLCLILQRHDGCIGAPVDELVTILGIPHLWIVLSASRRMLTQMPGYFDISKVVDLEFRAASREVSWVLLPVLSMV